jgi:hypothetical protein
MSCGRVDDVLDWSIPGDDEDFVKRNIDLLSQSDGLILGRESYEFFEDGAERMDLELVDSTAIPSGVAILTYRPQR